MKTYPQNRMRTLFQTTALCLLVTQVAPTGADENDTGEEEQAVDLDSLDEEAGEKEVDLDKVEESQSPQAPSGHPGGHGDLKLLPPKIKLFFDLLVEYEFITNTFQFTSEHAYVILEVLATDWLSFRADISPTPEFFEIIFNLGTVAELRLGKIIVPFGQNEFHHLIGGRVDIGSRFLPTVWGDYGISFRHFVYDGDVVNFEYSLWGINGFQETTETINGEKYPVPSRNDGNLTDNNKWKGFGIRPALGLGRSFVVGTSWYLDAWDEDSEQLMLFYGVDVEFGYGLMPAPFLRDLRIRGEIAWAEILLPGRNYYTGPSILPAYGTRRAGYVAELSYRPVRWLVLRYREGLLNDDNRFTDANDRLIHEPGVVLTFGPVQFYLLMQFHQILADDPYPEDVPESAREYSRLYLRVLFRY